jgi:hypothetical protein
MIRASKNSARSLPRKILNKRLKAFSNVGTLHAQFRLPQHLIHPKRLNHPFFKLVERFAWLDGQKELQLTFSTVLDFVEMIEA